MRALICLSALCLSFTQACTPNQAPRSVKLYQIPWPNENGTYQLQNVSVETFDSPETLQGAYAKIFVDPYVADGRLQGSTPVGRFIVTREGVGVPADFSTLQATTLYAHMERLFHLDAQAGVAQKINWPLMIGIQANVSDRKGAILNNALFDGTLDALLIVPFVDDPTLSSARLPISLNAGILAHEHFHKIFQVMVLNRIKGGEDVAALGIQQTCDWGFDLQKFDSQKFDSQKFDSQKTSRVRKSKAMSAFDLERAEKVPEKTFNSYLLRGLNEGLADFWGWVYTGDSRFIEHSLGSKLSEERRLDHEPGQLPAMVSLKMHLLNLDEEVISEGERLSKAYALGTIYARFLRELALVYGDEKNLEARMSVAKAVIAALPFVAETSIKSFTTDYLSPDLLLKALFLNLPQASEEVNQRMCELHKEFAGADEGYHKPTHCTAETAEDSAIKMREMKDEQ